MCGAGLGLRACRNARFATCFLDDASPTNPTWLWQLGASFSASHRLDESPSAPGPAAISAARPPPFLPA
eukprot:365370-Chlamydomonas_euryale.AAC.8